GEVAGPEGRGGVGGLPELGIRPEWMVGLQDVGAVVAVLAVAGRVVDVPAPADAMELGGPYLPGVVGGAPRSPDDGLLVAAHPGQVGEAHHGDGAVARRRLHQEQGPFEGDDPRVLARER